MAMSVFDIITLFGGLAFFLFGMNLMGSALEKLAGGRLKLVLRNMTSTPLRGFLLGTAVTAVIQSSSATTVMLVGFVNSGLMSLEQSAGVTLGANLGAVATFWLLSLSGIHGTSVLVQLCKPETFTPVLAFVGILLYMFQKNPRRKDVGMVLLGFAVLMFGMNVMSGSVAGLRDMPGFTHLLTLFSNPVLGVLAGTIITAIIQSSAASVGILQALSLTCTVTYASVVPIAMGQNIGTCISALISCAGTSRNAKRTALLHLFFNILSMLLLLPIYWLLDHFIHFPFTAQAATPLGIAIVHTVYKLISVAIFLPLSGWLVKLTQLVLPDGKKDKTILFDDRLLATPTVAVARCHEVTLAMAENAAESISMAYGELVEFHNSIAVKVREMEGQVDEYEDHLGTYLVKLSAQAMSEADSAETNRLLHIIGDFERISDHAVNILESAEEVHDKKLRFSDQARKELAVMHNAVEEILHLSVEAFRDNDLTKATMVEPLEQVIDGLRDTLKRRHIERLQRGECTIELGFVLTDLLTNFERVSDHCSNIAGCLLEMAHEDMDIHAYLRQVRASDGSEYNNYYDYFLSKYTVA